MMGMYLVSLNFTLQIVKMVNFVLTIFYQNKKNYMLYFLLLG